MVVLAIDVGSSSVRAALFDADGNRVPESLERIDVELSADVGGVVEADAVALREAIECVIDEVLRHPDATSIDGVGMTTFWHSLVVVDDQHTPLTPVLTWADTRSEPEAGQLREQLDGRDVHQRTGCMIHPSYLPAKIIWLKQHESEVMQRAAGLWSFAQYCTAVWLGSASTSVSMASGSGLFNRLDGVWDADVLTHLDVDATMLGGFVPGPELLPPIVEPYADRWPALRGAPWRAPIGDGAASNVGAGCVTADRLALMVGTSGAIRRCAPVSEAQGPVPDGLWRYSLDRTYALTGGALSDGGSVYAWMQETLSLPDAATLEQELADRQPEQHGLSVLPFWSGERSPGWVGDATALIAGLRLHTSPVDIAQAVLESVAYRFAALYDALGTGAETIVATGGGLRSSPAWLQIMADAIGKPVAVSDIAEASLRGAALVALRDCGVIAELPSGLEVSRYLPRPAYHEQHRLARERQAILYEREIGRDGAQLLARQTR